MPQFSLKKAKECGVINEQITDRIVALYLLNEEWHKLPSSMHAKIAAEVGASASSMQPQFSKFFSKLKDNDCQIAPAEGGDAAADTAKETTTTATTKKAAPKKAAPKTTAPKKGVATKAAPKKRKADDNGGEDQPNKSVKKATRGKKTQVKSEETVEKSEDDEDDAKEKEKVEDA